MQLMSMREDKLQVISAHASLWHGPRATRLLLMCSGEAACNGHFEKGTDDRWSFRVFPSICRDFDCNSVTMLPDFGRPIVSMVPKFHDEL